MSPRPMPVAPRFWANVRKGDGCWEWGGARGRHGYGHMKVNARYTLAHRVSYELHNGPIPDGLCVLHRCDNKPCVRPDHLFLGDHSDNHIDMVLKGLRPNTRLTPDKVREIRASDEKQDVLAARYGVTQSSISLIQRRINWRHVT